MSIARTISDQIRAGITTDGISGDRAILCWGARQFTNIGDGLAFRVSGMHFKGIVEIKLNSEDLYDIKFIKGCKTKHSYNGVYCDQLTSMIDNFVED